MSGWDVLTGADVLYLVWVIGTAIHASRLFKHWAAITNADPVDLCDGCRDERRRVMHEATQLQVLGSAGIAVLLLVEAAGWWARPIVPVVRKMFGREPLPKCSKGSCVAYTSVREER